MERIALAASEDIAAPSPELCLIAGLIVSMTKGKPKAVARLVEDMRDFVQAQKQLGDVVRLRGAEYDTQVIASMGQASAWLERLEPFLMMMARR